MRSLALCLLLLGCVTLPSEGVSLEQAVKTYTGHERKVYELPAGAVLTSRQLQTFLTRKSGPDQDGTITYTYPGVVVYHNVAAGRFVIVSDRASPGS